MILAAGVAAQAASALATAMRNRSHAAPSGAGSASTDFQNLTADIDALLPGGGGANTTGPGSGTGSVGGDLLSLGSDLLGNLGLGAQPAPPANALQAYSAANAVGA